VSEHRRAHTRRDRHNHKAWPGRRLSHLLGELATAEAWPLGSRERRLLARGLRTALRTTQAEDQSHDA
jgi:hypothetical protein